MVMSLGMYGIYTSMIWYAYMVCLYGMLIWYAYILQEVPTGAIPGCPTGGALLGADERRKA